MANADDQSRTAIEHSQLEIAPFINNPSVHPQPAGFGFVPAIRDGQCGRSFCTPGGN